MCKKNVVWLLPAAFLIVTSSCDSGGIGCSCMDGGMEPIPGGFPSEYLVENAVQARITPHAITFLEENVDSLIGMFMPDGLDFPIDPMTQNIDLVGDVDICHPSGCLAHAEVLGADIVPTPDDTLHIVAQVRFWIEGTMPLDIHFGLLCVWLTVRQNIWCWAAAAVSTGLYLFIMYHARLYMESALQVFYLAMAAYGWYQWRRGGADHAGVRVTTWPWRAHLLAACVVAYDAGLKRTAWAGKVAMGACRGGSVFVGAAFAGALTAPAALVGAPRSPRMSSCR